MRCFSRISWFLSSLLFCYFCTPFLLKGIKTIKSSLLLFVTVAFIRIVIEEYIRKGKETINILDLDFHRGPGIRCMEFFLGMLTIPTFFKIKKILEPLRNNFFIKVLFTIVQLVSPLIIYNLMLKYDQILLRCHFVLIFCFFIFIFGYDYGYLSDILSSKSCKLIMSCQMEMYLLQRTVNTIIKQIISNFNWKFNDNSESQYIIKTIIIFIVAFVYKSLLKQPLAKMLDSIVKILQHLYK